MTRLIVIVLRIIGGSLIVLAALQAFAVVAVKPLHLSDRAAIYFLVIGLALQVVKPAIGALEGYVSQRQATEIKQRQLLVQWPPPTLNRVDPFDDLGVFRSDIADRFRGSNTRPPYIGRNIDAFLDQELQQAGLVYIVGPSKSGKTRTAFESCRRVFPDQKVLIPSTPQVLREITDSGTRLELRPLPTILWLDDLERFIEVGALTPGLVQRWWRNGERRIIAVGTIRDEQYARLRNAEGDVQRTARLLFDSAQVREINLSEHATERERADARISYPGEDFGQGIGSHFVAGRELVTRFRTGETLCPAGYAVVRAAVDWQRIGMLRLIADGDIGKLYCRYLRMIRPDLDPSDSVLDDGLAWTRKPIASSAALISRVDGSNRTAYAAIDYIVSHIEGEFRSALGTPFDIPAESRTYCASLVEGVEAVHVGFRAYSNQQDSVARIALDKVGSVPESILPFASFLTGSVLQRLGDLEAAASALKTAVGTEDPGVAPVAAYLLAGVLDDLGDTEGAEEAYRKGMQSSDGSFAAAATFDLGQMLKSHGEHARAIEAFRQASALKHPVWSPRAAVNLGSLLLEKNEIEAAIEALELARAGEDADARARSMLFLGSTFQDEGSHEKAIEQYEAAINSGVADQAAKAALNVGLLYERLGKVPEAIRAYRTALSLDGPVTDDAALQLGRVLANQRDWEGAAAAFSTATKSDNIEQAAEAALSLGMVRHQLGDVPREIEAYRLAAAYAAGDDSSLAGLRLADLLSESDDLSAAIDGHRTVMGTAGPVLNAKVATNLGNLLRKYRDATGAMDAYRVGITVEDVDVAAVAAFNLGMLCSDLGNLVDARDAFEIAARATNESLAAAALAKLETVRYQLQEEPGQPTES